MATFVSVPQRHQRTPVGELVSMALVLLTTVICFLSMIASWGITKYVRGYCMLFLILETGILGTFLALHSIG